MFPMCFLCTYMVFFRKTTNRISIHAVKLLWGMLYHFHFSFSLQHRVLLGIKNLWAARMIVQGIRFICFAHRQSQFVLWLHLQHCQTASEYRASSGPKHQQVSLSTLKNFDYAYYLFVHFGGYTWQYSGATLALR